MLGHEMKNKILVRSYFVHCRMLVLSFPVQEQEPVRILKKKEGKKGINPIMHCDVQITQSKRLVNQPPKIIIKLAGATTQICIQQL